MATLLKAIVDSEGKNALEYTIETKLGSQRTVERYMQQLRNAGLIEFKGDATQTGGYYLTDTMKQIYNQFKTDNRGEKN